MSPTPPPSAGKKTSGTREPTTQLPLLRVKRIIKVDKEIQKCGNEAATLITRATELFVQYLAEQGHYFAKTENRKTIQYKDLANAVVRIDQLEFLSAIIPRTLTYKRAVQRREQLLREDDPPERNGSSVKKRPRTSGARRGGGENVGRGGGIERYFSGGDGGNGVTEDEVSMQDDSMDIDE